METGDLIVYTSADPVMQIAAHEDIIPLEELYRICEYAREITKRRSIYDWSYHLHVHMWVNLATSKELQTVMTMP